MSISTNHPPASRLRLLAGGAIAGALVVGVIFSNAVGDAAGESPGPDVTSTIAASLPAPTAPDEPVDRVSGGSASVPDVEIRALGSRVLEAWARRANSGDSGLLESMFHPLSPQVQLLAEMTDDTSEVRKAYVFTLFDPVVEPSSPGFVAMTGRVVTSRGTEVLGDEPWRLVVAWSEEHDQWLIWTLEELG